MNADAELRPAQPATEANATQALPQSVAEGEDATRRHIADGLKAGDMDPVTGKKVLYYHDPMVPGNKFDKPAKSPFMDMMLVPVYADSDGDQGKVTVSQINASAGLLIQTFDLPGIGIFLGVSSRFVRLFRFVAPGAMVGIAVRTLMHVSLF